MMADEKVRAYLNILGDIPVFLNKYLEHPKIKRLQNVCYFCGMDYASKDIYPFTCHISRYDHSLTTSLLTWKFTKRKQDTIAALFHDVATPCFSHVIDYMNQDYDKQESTEKYHIQMLLTDSLLKQMLEEDDLSILDIADFKKYPIVDNERPKLCADRMDGIILTSMGWTNQLSIEEIPEIINALTVYQNEEGNSELGFSSMMIADKVMRLNQEIDEYCHSVFDHYMMLLLARMTKIMIEEKKISYEQLYELEEHELFKIFYQYADENKDFNQLLDKFQTIHLDEIPELELPYVKRRNINPIVLEKRYLDGR